MTTTLPEFPVEGGCQCGAVRYQLTAPPLSVYRCHCKDCQRFSGATHSMSMVVRTETLAVLEGVAAIHEKTADSGRVTQMHGCARCGTRLWNASQLSPQTLVLKPGTLDEMDWAEPVGNIWTASKAPWIEIATDEPSYSGQPPNRDELITAWQTRHG